LSTPRKSDFAILFHLLHFQYLPVRSSFAPEVGAMFRAACALAVACLAASPAGAQIDGFEREPINYKTAQAENVSQ
jgi:hypothetical protein